MNTWIWSCAHEHDAHETFNRVMKLYRRSFAINIFCNVTLVPFNSSLEATARIACGIQSECVACDFC